MVKYTYDQEFGRKPELILYWHRDSVVIFKWLTTLLINYNQLIVNEISGSGVIVRDDHGKGTFSFPMKFLFVTKFENILTVQVVLLTYYTKNGGILKNRIIDKLQEFFTFMLKRLSQNLFWKNAVAIVIRQIEN